MPDACNQLPNRLEIVVLPLVGVALVERLHTRDDELVLFFIPFLICVLRLYLNGLRRSSVERYIDALSRVPRAVCVAAALDNLSLVPLLMLECAAVIASSPTTPGAAWAWTWGFYVLYVLLRLFSRAGWRRALTLGSSPIRPP